MYMRIIRLRYLYAVGTKTTALPNTVTRTLLAIDFFFFFRYDYEMDVWITKEDITRKPLVLHSLWRKRPRWATNNIIIDDVVTEPICNTFDFVDFNYFLFYAHFFTSHFSASPFAYIRLPSTLFAVLHTPNVLLRISCTSSLPHANRLWRPEWLIYRYIFFESRFTYGVITVKRNKKMTDVSEIPVWKPRLPHTTVASGWFFSSL